MPGWALFLYAISLALQNIKEVNVESSGGVSGLLPSRWKLPFLHEPPRGRAFIPAGRFPWEPQTQWTLA